MKVDQLTDLFLNQGHTAKQILESELNDCRRMMSLRNVSTIVGVRRTMIEFANKWMMFASLNKLDHLAFATAASTQWQNDSLTLLAKKT